MKLLLYILLLSLTLYSTTVAQVVQSYVETDESFTMNKIYVNDVNYWIVYINGSETFIVGPDKNIIEDHDLIREVIFNYSSENFNVSEKLHNLRLNFTNFISSLVSSLAKCEQYTGLDRIDCNDKNSCIVSCSSVTLCKMQIRDDLINGMINFSNSRHNLYPLISEINSTIYLSNPTYQDYSKIINLLQSLRDIISGINSNYLVVSRYCDVVNGNSEYYDNSLNLANDLYSFYGGSSIVYSRADLIFTRTKHRLDYFRTRDEIYSELYGNVSSGLSRLNSDYLKANFTSSNISSDLKVLSTYLQNATEYKNVGNYHKSISLLNETLGKINNLTMQIKILNIKASDVKLRARNVVDYMENSQSIIDGTSYEAEFNSLKANLSKYTGAKVKDYVLPTALDDISEIDTRAKTLVGSAAVERQSSINSRKSSLLCVLSDFISNLLRINLGLC